MTARLLDGGATFVCRTRDVSEHGVLLETAEMLAPGTELSLSLLDEETGSVMELDGVVARASLGTQVGTALIGVRLGATPEAWHALVARASARAQGSITKERPAKRLRVLVVADDVARRGAVALYVTSGWDVRFASDLASTEEALRGVAMDAVIAEHDLDEGRWAQILEAARRAQPHARRIVRSALHGQPAPAPGRKDELVHRVVDLQAGLDAVLDALAADWGSW